MVTNIEIDVQKVGDFDKAIRQFKKQCAGILAEVKRRGSFKTYKERRRFKDSKSAARRRKLEKFQFFKDTRR